MERFKLAFLVFFLFLFPGMPLSAFGGDGPWGAEMYTGVQGDTQGQVFTYLGGGVDYSVGGAWALTIKTLGSYQIYKYVGTTDEVEAKAPGLRLQAGVKYARGDAYLILTGGVDYRNTSLNPDDPGAEVREAQTGVIIEAINGKEHFLSEKISMDLIGSFSTLGESFWGRARLKHLLAPLSNEGERKVSVGMEVAGGGSDDYASFQVGAVLEVKNLTKRFSVLFASGYRHNEGIPGSGYLGLEFYHRF